MAVINDTRRLTIYSNNNSRTSNMLLFQVKGAPGRRTTIELRCINRGGESEIKVKSPKMFINTVSDEQSLLRMEFSKQRDGIMENGGKWESEKGQ